MSPRTRVYTMKPGQAGAQSGPGLAAHFLFSGCTGVVGAGLGGFDPQRPASL